MKIRHDLVEFHGIQVRASWVGYAVEEVLKAVLPDEAYFWATHQGAEIDPTTTKCGQRHNRLRNSLNLDVSGALADNDRNLVARHTKKCP
jgi:hypothetical protein